jgi:hypothetical protein
MCAYKPFITPRALNDLSVQPPAVQIAILHVVDTQLRIWPREDDPDEGLVPDFWSSYTQVQPARGLRWRRGITPEVRYGLEAGLALDPSLEHACEYLILYLVEPLPPGTARWAPAGSGRCESSRTPPWPRRRSGSCWAPTSPPTPKARRSGPGRPARPAVAGRRRDPPRSGRSATAAPSRCGRTPAGR